MNLRAVLAFLALATIATTAAVPASAAGPASPSCGSVLTVDTQLTQDLTCAGDALIVQGGVRLDLGGHQVVATGGTAVTLVGRGSPSVLNGQLVQSTTGLAADRDDDNGVPWTVAVTGVSFSDNDIGLKFFGWEGSGSSLDVTDAHFSRNDTGLKSTLGRGKIQVLRSTFDDNSAAVAHWTGELIVDHSTFRRNADAVTCAEARCSIIGNRMRDNVSGVSFDTDSSGPIRGNNISGSTTAISTFLSWARIERNTLSRNEVAVLSNWSSDVVYRNYFSKNQTGVRLGESGITAGLTVASNMFVDNVNGAYVVEELPAQPVASDHVTFSNNTLLKSSGWAIYAPTSTDGGGNRAIRGGDSGECVGIVC